VVRRTGQQPSHRWERANNARNRVHHRGRLRGLPGMRKAVQGTHCPARPPAEVYLPICRLPYVPPTSETPMPAMTTWVMSSSQSNPGVFA
jgi:hypothetical protein